jgi:dolichol-phosphate mannosyltransferase
VEGYENILVIDGYSQDNTVPEANNNGVKVLYQTGTGKSGALKTAIEHVKTPYFLVMDGDCTYHPRDINNFIPHLLNYDQVIGTRMYGRDNIPIFNRFGNWLINVTFNLLFSTNLNDVCSGMYALRTEFARSLIIRTSGFDVEVEIASQTAMKGKITEVPINYYERVGTQKLRPIRHGIQIYSSIYKLALRHNPIFIYSIISSITLIPSVIILSLALIQTFYHNALHIGWTLIGILLLLMGMFSFFMSILSVFLQRIERRMMRRISTTKDLT